MVRNIKMKDVNMVDLSSNAVSSGDKFLDMTPLTPPILPSTQPVDMDSLGLEGGGELAGDPGKGAFDRFLMGEASDGLDDVTLVESFAHPAIQPKVVTAEGAVIPLQKDSLAIQDPLPESDLEVAESIMEEEVSTSVLAYAMAVQEKEMQATPVKASRGHKELTGPDHTQEFFALKDYGVETVKTQHIPIPEMAKEGAPMVALEEAEEVDVAGTKASPFLQGKPVEASDKETTKGAGSAVFSPDRAAKTAESEGGFDQGEADADLGQSLDKASGKAGKATSKEAGKSFSEALAQAQNVTSKNKGKAESATATPAQIEIRTPEGKAVEQAFTTKVSETSAAKPASPTHTSQSTQSPLPTAQEQIAMTLKNMPKGKTEVTLQLRPDTLGRVHVKIDINQDGQALVVVSTDRQETRDMLQQDARQLTDLLKEAEMDLSEGDISYNLFEDQEPSDKEQGQENATSSQDLESTGPMIPLQMEEVRVPRHGGLWEARA